MRFARTPKLGGHHGYINIGLKRFNGCIGLTKKVSDSLHIHCIGHCHALKTQLTPQNVVLDFSGHRCGRNNLLTRIGQNQRAV